MKRITSRLPTILPRDLGCRAMSGTAIHRKPRTHIGVHSESVFDGAALTARENGRRSRRTVITLMGEFRHRLQFGA